MSLARRVGECRFLSAQEKLVMGLLGHEPRTARAIVAVLMSDPYDLTFYEVFDALQGLRSKGLIVLDNFVGNISIFEIDTYFTFTPDWVVKL